MDSHKPRSLAEEKIAEAARAILEGELSITEGCRAIASQAFRVNSIDSSRYSTFLGVESETEEFPVGAERHHWSQEALVQKDLERAQYEARVRDVVLAACRDLLQYMAP